MAGYGVASSPVYDNATNKPIGMADVRLIAKFLVSIYSTHLSTTRVIGDQPVASLLAPPASPLLILSSLDSVAVALSHLTQWRRHLIVQFPLPHCEQRLLSRTDLVRWLCNSSKAFPVFDRSLTWLNLSKPVRALVTMTEDETAITGLQRLINRQVSAMPVVSRRTGQVLGTLSCSVVRYFDVCTNTSLLHDLRLPVLAFLERYHPPSLQPVVCRPCDTLLPTVLSILTHGVHRSWVVDEAQVPVSCVALSDVLRLVMATSCRRAPSEPNANPTSASRASLQAVVVSLS